MVAIRRNHEACGRFQRIVLRLADVVNGACDDVEVEEELWVCTACGRERQSKEGFMEHSCRRLAIRLAPSSVVRRGDGTIESATAWDFETKVGVTA